jgi:hypothetical protein
MKKPKHPAANLAKGGWLHMPKAKKPSAPKIGKVARVARAMKKPKGY